MFGAILGEQVVSKLMAREALNKPHAYVGSHYERTSHALIKKCAASRRDYYVGERRIAMRTGGQTYYLFLDHLGSTHITASSVNGAELGRLLYRPWGETRVSTGTTLTTWRFTGQREDATIGLYYYGARYYDPLLGRFAQADTIVPDPGNPQSLNRYSYVLNNALKYTDPTGHAYDAGGAAGPSCTDGSASYMACTYPESHPLAGYWIGTTQAEADAGWDKFVAGVEVVAGVLFEPADWAITGNHWRQGDFHVLDLAGLLPLVPASGVRALRHADEVEGIARRLDKDLFAFGNRAGPRPPRVGIDVSPNVDGILSPQTLPFPKGASTFADPGNAPLTGHYHSLPAGTELPHGLDVVADGLDVNVASPHPETHHTIFNTVEMDLDRFVEMFTNLPWQYGGRK